MTGLTDNETKVLRSVFANDYGEEGDMVWSWAHNDSREPHNLPAASAAGVIGSLVKKGLMFSQEYEPNEDIIGLTDEGRKTARAAA